MITVEAIGNVSLTVLATRRDGSASGMARKSRRGLDLYAARV